jgi:hypothetical protein
MMQLGRDAARNLSKGPFQKGYPHLGPLSFAALSFQVISDTNVLGSCSVAIGRSPFYAHLLMLRERAKSTATAIVATS